jgi:hypothetical protein
MAIPTTSGWGLGQTDPRPQALTRAAWLARRGVVKTTGESRSGRLYGWLQTGRAQRVSFGITDYFRNGPRVSPLAPQPSIVVVVVACRLRCRTHTRTVIPALCNAHDCTLSLGVLRELFPRSSGFGGPTQRFSYNPGQVILGSSCFCQKRLHLCEEALNCR